MFFSYICYLVCKWLLPEVLYTTAVGVNYYYSGQGGGNSLSVLFVHQNNGFILDLKVHLCHFLYQFQEIFYRAVAFCRSTEP